MSPSAPRPKVQEPVQEPAQEPVTVDTLPEGQSLVSTPPKGQWNALVGEDGENVTVDGKPVRVE